MAQSQRKLTVNQLEAWLIKTKTQKTAETNIREVDRKDDCRGKQILAYTSIISFLYYKEQAPNTVCVSPWKFLPKSDAGFWLRFFYALWQVTFNIYSINSPVSKAFVQLTPFCIARCHQMLRQCQCIYYFHSPLPSSIYHLPLAYVCFVVWTVVLVEASS